MIGKAYIDKNNDEREKLPSLFLSQNELFIFKEYFKLKLL